MKFTFLKSVTKLEDLPEGDKPQIAFVGRSNVGKSSLINHLANQRQLARVSAEPGRTQTINLFDIDGRFLLVDLPGYGYAKASKEKRQDFFEMLNDYLWHSEQLALVFLIVDARLGPTDSDTEMLRYLVSKGIATVMILNKIDKLSRSDIANLVRSLEASYPEIQLIPHSNVSGDGLGEILEVIQKKVREAAS